MRFSTLLQLSHFRVPLRKYRNFSPHLLQNKHDPRYYLLLDLLERNAGQFDVRRKQFYYMSQNSECTDGFLPIWTKIQN